MLKASFEMNLKSLRSVNLACSFELNLHCLLTKPSCFNLRLTDCEIIIKMVIGNITIISFCHLGINIIW